MFKLRRGIQNRVETHRNNMSTDLKPRKADFNEKNYEKEVSNTDYTCRSTDKLAVLGEKGDYCICKKYRPKSACAVRAE